MASRNSAYFHLLRSYFLTPAAALVAWTWIPLRREHEGEVNERPTNDFVKETQWLNGRDSVLSSTLSPKPSKTSLG